MTEPNYWTKILSFKQLTPTTFTTTSLPQRMGNALPIAYGGFAMASAIKAACLTLPSPSYHLYSLLGNYLGPASTEKHLLTSVRIVRQTRTFATRYIEVSQQQDDGSERVCMVALADFQVAEPESLLTYSAPPTKKYSHWKECVDTATHLSNMVRDGKVGQKLVDMQNTSFGLFARLFNTRPCPEGIFAQLITGLAKHLPTTQDHLELTDRSTADWVKLPDVLEDQTENVACLGFLLDGALAFAPLTFSHMFLDDSSATSSLDFALRVFSNKVEMGEWHLREMVTHVGAEGRTYSEARMWDEGGRCVASMTQQSIMRPRKKKGGKL